MIKNRRVVGHRGSGKIAHWYSGLDRRLYMAKLGFLGLGIMGYPMARHLLQAGHDVAVWSHNKGKAQKLAADEKGKFCDTPEQVGEHAEAIFLCVGDTAMVKEIVLGHEGLIRGTKPGTVMADCSTIGPSDSRAIG